MLLPPRFFAVRVGSEDLSTSEMLHRTRMKRVRFTFQSSFNQNMLSRSADDGHRLFSLCSLTCVYSKALNSVQAINLRLTAELHLLLKHCSINYRQEKIRNYLHRLEQNSLHRFAKREGQNQNKNHSPRPPFYSSNLINLSWLPLLILQGITIALMDF